MNRIVLLPIMAAIILSGCIFKDTTEKIKFKQEEWIQGDRRIRGKMVDNIIEDSLLYGKTKSGVLSLLGYPTAGDTAGTLIYQVDIGKKIGPGGTGGIWLFFLTVEFDSLNDKVINTRCND